MITVTKRGPVYLNNKIVCNRPGIIAEVVYDKGAKIGVNPNIKNTYTINYACEGTPVSFFCLKKKGLTDTTLDKAWFIDFEKAYFLCTLNRLDGYASHWCEKKDFGEIILSKLSESHFQNLDGDFAWTFLLTNDETLKLLYIWDIECQEYISPLSSLWKVPDFCENTNFIKTKHGTYTQLTKAQMKEPLIESNIELMDGMPLSFTIYCGDVIYSIRVLTKTDMYINKIRNRSPNKFEALLLSRFKGEDTLEFERRYFTYSEIKDFEYRLKRGFERFKTEIYEKNVLKSWVCFPNKIYNTIRLGDILDMNVSIREKQERACNAIKSCNKGWKQSALMEFYKAYVE